MNDMTTRNLKMNNVVTLNSEEAFFFSDKTDADLAQQLQRVSLTRDPDMKEAILLETIERWPDVLDTYIALYKFFFRTGQYRKAEVQVWQTLREAARQGGFNRNYHRLNQDSADWLDDKSVARLYLFSLKALGVVRLRRGRVEKAEQVLTKLLELDIHDELGGGNFLDIALSFRDDDEE